MCGIAGIINFNQRPVNREDIDEMLDTMKYRGPNDRDVFLKGRVGLGHLRLSILDLSPAGRQPMKDDDGFLAIVYNGEIYNYLEIRNELKDRGYSFKTGTDTEIILAAYSEWGEKCVEKFNGMWAFAIFDERKNRIFFSRDHFGIKPLFYHLDENNFFFASEIKAILPRLARREINNPFLYNFISRDVPYGSNETVFKGINLLLPAHNLLIELKGKPETKIWRYWDFNPAVFKKKYDYADPAETFRELLIDSVKLRLRSDVPVGVCLSGGLDSSVITCIISKILKQEIETFSSIYKEEGYSEKEFADEINKECGTRSNLIHPSPENFFEIIKKLVRHHDKPVRMPGSYSQWHVFKCAAEKVIVTLDGQGADEILAGYMGYLPYYLADLLKDFRLGRYLSDIKRIKGNLPSDYRKGILKIFLPFLSRFKRSVSGSEAWQDQILTEEFIQEHKRDAEKMRLDPPRIFNSHLNQELYRTFTTTNLPMLLDNEDRISMACSLEARVPFLDQRLVEFCFGLDYDWKIRNGMSKFIMRESFKDILPEKIYNRKDKKGFPTPLEHWFRENLRGKMENLFNSDEYSIHGILDPVKAQNLLANHLAGKDYSRILWRALTIHFWLKEYFNK